MIEKYMVIYVLFVHFVGDFLLQSRKIAEKKSFDIRCLCFHGVIYGSFLFAMMSFFMEFADSIYFASVNTALHLATDYISSKLSAKAYREGNMFRFWGIIGVDQMLHSIALISFL